MGPEILFKFRVVKPGDLTHPFPPSLPVSSAARWGPWECRDSTAGRSWVGYMPCLTLLRWR